MVDNVDHGKLFEVHFNRTECLVGCVCDMFEFRGILCIHALYVLSHESVSIVPRRYILDRLINDIEWKYTYVSSSYDDVYHRPILDRYQKLHKLAIGVFKIRAKYVENFNVLNNFNVYFYVEL